MRPIKLDLDLPDVDADGICESQTTGGAANLLLNGDLCDLGTASVFEIGNAYTKDTGGVRIGFTSAGDLSGITFTITGLDEDKAIYVETVAGPNANTIEANTFWSKITQISVDAAVGTAVEVGTVDSVATKSIPVNWRSLESFTVAAMGVTGVIQYDIDESFDQTASELAINWHTVLGSKSTDYSDSLSRHARVTRLIVNSYSSGAELQFHVIGV